MNKDEYQNKIEEHRKPIEINDGNSTNSRKTRRSGTGKPNKTKQKSNYLLPILFFFFILIPVSFLIYVFAFYQPNANETTVFDDSQVQYEQNEKEVESVVTDEEDTNSDAVPEVESEQNETSDSETVPDEPTTPEKSVEVVEQPVEEISEEQSPDEQPTGTKTHVVQPGENLYRIALKYYNSADAVEQIRAANNLSSDSISTGQTLVLP